MDLIILAFICSVLTIESIIILNFPYVIDLPSNIKLNEAIIIYNNTHRKELILLVIQFIIWVGFVIGFLATHRVILVLPITVFILGVILSSFHIILNNHRYKSIIAKMQANG